MYVMVKEFADECDRWTRGAPPRGDRARCQGGPRRLRHFAGARKQIARDLAPAIAWPTLALAVVLPSAFAAIVALGLTRVLPLWLCTPILAIVSYAHYTLVHEIHPRQCGEQPAQLGLD